MFIQIDRQVALFNSQLPRHVGLYCYSDPSLEQEIPIIEKELKFTVFFISFTDSISFAQLNR